MTTKDVNKLRILNRIGLVKDEVLSLYENKPLINIEGLHVNFKRGGKLFEAVKDANLKINNGEILGLVGESGSGKTTLGRATISLWDHALGKVEIDGERTPSKRIRSITRKNIWVYKKGQMIYQDPTSSLNRQLKVLDIVNEGQKNFKTLITEKRKIADEGEELIKEINKTIWALSTKEAYTSFSLRRGLDQFLIDEISSSTDAKIKALVKDYNEYVDLSEKLEKSEEQLNGVDKDIASRIKILKQKRSTEKLTLSGSTSTDKEFFDTAYKNELSEFKRFSKKVTEDEVAVQKRVDKRNEKFFKKTLKKAKHIPASLRSAIPAKYNDVKGLEKAIAKLENCTSLKADEKFYANSIAITFQVLIKKLDKLVSPLNTNAFDFIYFYINDVLLDRIHFYNRLLSDLEIRLGNEISKRTANESDEFLFNFYDESVKYLEEYKEIIISLIKEYANISLDIKNLFIEHEENGIKHLYQEMNKINKVSDQLQVSIITWKSDEAIKYHKRLKVKQKRDLTREIEDLKEKIDVIKEKYIDIASPMRDIKEILAKKLEKFEKDFKVTDAEYKKQLGKEEELKEKLALLKEEVHEANKIIRDKKYRKEKEVERIKETLLQVGLSEDSLNKYPSQFSGGQKQRIGIARTIITKPKYIVADEPISALDVSVQAQVINLLKDLHQEMGLTMLFIAHDLQMVNYISDKIVVIYRGKIVEYGTADKVYNSPKHPYTKSLIGAMPSIEEVGKPLQVSDYNWADHEYNEFSITKLWEVEKDHFVFGTEDEIKEWK